MNINYYYKIYIAKMINFSKKKPTKIKLLICCFQLHQLLSLLLWIFSFQPNNIVTITLALFFPKAQMLRKVSYFQGRIINLPLMMPNFS